METLNLGIEMPLGADFDLVIGIFGITGAVDLTGYQFLGEMKTSTDPDADVVAEFDFTISDQVLKKGQVLMSLSTDAQETVVTSISSSLYRQRLTTPFTFDVKMKDTSGTISRIIQGLIYASPDVTQEVFS